jgi:hypothetical protein
MIGKNIGLEPETIVNDFCFWLLAAKGFRELLKIIPQRKCKGRNSLLIFEAFAASKSPPLLRAADQKWIVSD